MSATVYGIRDGQEFELVTLNNIDAAQELATELIYTLVSPEHKENLNRHFGLVGVGIIGKIEDETAVFNRVGGWDYHHAKCEVSFSVRVGIK